MKNQAELVERLAAAHVPIAPELREEILSLGTMVEPWLLALIHDDRMFDFEAPGLGWTPLHAIELLGALGSEAAIPRLIELLAILECGSIAHGRAHFALAALGRLALEPCLAAYGASVDEQVRAELAETLSELGVHDDRIYQLLLDRLSDDLAMVAADLGAYGDRRAIPILARELELFEVDASYDPEVHPVNELCQAIERLGGTLTGAQTEKLSLANSCWRSSPAGRAILAGAQLSTYWN